MRQHLKIVSDADAAEATEPQPSEVKPQWPTSVDQVNAGTLTVNLAAAYDMAMKQSQPVSAAMAIAKVRALQLDPKEVRARTRHELDQISDDELLAVIRHAQDQIAEQEGKGSQAGRTSA